jgi:putative membrane protein (TIGR04086 family)
MNVRWIAVLTGFFVDIFVSQLLVLFASPEFFTSPDLTRPGDVLLISLLVLSTGVGGYVAGRMARSDRWLNGLLVAIIGILVGQLSAPLPRPFVIATAISCGVAALGGYLSRFPPQRPSRSSNRG